MLYNTFLTGSSYTTAAYKPWIRQWDNSHTGSVGEYEKEFVLHKQKKLLIVILPGTGSTRPCEYSWSDQTEDGILTPEQLKSNISSKEPLIQIKQLIGLNILEMAAVLRISRPTLYDWLESKTTIRKIHQKRINSIYEICKKWEIKNLGRLGSYLHKPIGVENISLFDLLKSSILDLESINEYLENIGSAILKRNKENIKHDALLKKHGFQPMSKRDKEDRLEDIDLLG